MHIGLLKKIRKDSDELNRKKLLAVQERMDYLKSHDPKQYQEEEKKLKALQTSLRSQVEQM